jgi:uncharacterized protein YjbJ (UPF0337 family)
MDWQRIERNWKQFKLRVQDKWGKLTEEDLAAIDGRLDRLEEKIRQRYGFASDHVRKEIDDWTRWQHRQRPRRLPSPSVFLAKNDTVKKVHNCSRL